MATSDRDIIITPNRSQSNDPKIEFKGGGTAAGSASTITMTALPKGPNEGVVEFKGVDGNTIASFAEVNTGSLFSVSDDDGEVKFDVNETGVVNTSLNSGALGLPVGTTTERPSVPQAGFTRWNSTTKSMEIYNGENWMEVIADYFPSGSCFFGGD
tara:strand:- start:3916 stop:4383 length:468 start_codon:yes stop_codon:yes gene_type:complete